MIYFYFQGEYCLFKHYLFHVYACRFVPSAEYVFYNSIFLSLSPGLQSHSRHNRKWAPSDICCLCPLFLLLMIALSLITLTTDCSISLTKWGVQHTCHVSGIIIFRLLIQRKVCPRYKLPQVRCHRDSRKKQIFQWCETTLVTFCMPPMHAACSKNSGTKDPQLKRTTKCSSEIKIYRIFKRNPSHIA